MTPSRDIGWSKRCVRAMAAAMAIAALALPAGPADAADGALENSIPFEIVIEGPPGPYPYGHAEIRVTVYEGAIADAPPEVMNLAVAAEQVASLSLPYTLTIDVPAERLAKSIRPQVGAVISVGRPIGPMWPRPLSEMGRHGCR